MLTTAQIATRTANGRTPPQLGILAQGRGRPFLSRNGHLQDLTNPTGTGRHHDDPVTEQDSLLDAVRDERDRHTMHR